MLDLANLDTTKLSEDGATLEVRHPSTGAILSNGDGRAVTIVLAGMDSNRARKSERQATNRRLKASGRGRGLGLTGDDLDNDALDLLAACTLAWSGFDLEGQPLECNPDNARKLYRQFPWLREQAQQFVEDRSNFLRVSPTN